MSFKKNLLLTTALISTASITNAASITNGDFSDGPLGWNTSQKAGDPHSFNQIIGGQWSASQSYFEPSWANFSDSRQLILSQEIGRINNGDILSFDHTTTARLFFNEMVGYTASSGFSEDTSYFADALLNVNFYLRLRTDDGGLSPLISSYHDVANSLPGKPLSDLGEQYMLGSSQTDNYSFDLSELEGQDGLLRFYFEIDELDNDAEYYVDHLEELSSFTLLSQLDNIAITNEVPLPAAAWLFGSALLGLGLVRRK